MSTRPMPDLKTGDVVTACVSQITTYGAWVEWPDHQALVLIVDMDICITRHDGLHTRAVIA